VARAVSGRRAERLSGKAERTEADDLRRQVASLERALGRKTMEVEIAGELLRMS
jgi:transposase